MSLRPVKRLIKSKPTLEGAGVHLRRAFGFGNTSEFDPFLLLDDFRNDTRRITSPASPGIRIAASRPSPTSSRAPWSTATAWATSGAIAAGDIQWMTAGSGIIHQEMPKGDQRAACTASSSGPIFRRRSK